MNRAQRRKLSTRKGAIFVEVPAGSPLRDGEEFTITGHQRLPSGSWITDCKPGGETKLIAVTSKKPGTTRIIGA